MSWAGVPALEPQVERLFTILRAIAHHPGIGFDALLQAIGGSWAKATVLKDLRILKDMGLLADCRHRSGYFVSRNSLTNDERRALLTGLHVLAHNLRHPVQRKTLKRLMKRFEASKGQLEALTYPVLSVGNRVIVETIDDTVYDLMDHLQTFILTGQPIRYRSTSDPWQNPYCGWMQAYPLQLIFHDVAWYLLVERVSGGFATQRLDRMDPNIGLGDAPIRGLVEQQKALCMAQHYLSYSWNMMLPPDLDHLVDYAVQFSARVAPFIVEGRRRHPHQAIEQQQDGSVVYRVRLHQRAMTGFAVWVMGWGSHARVLADQALKVHVAEQVAASLAYYGDVLSPKIAEPDPT